MGSDVTFELHSCHLPCFVPTCMQPLCFTQQCITISDGGFDALLCSLTGRALFLTSWAQASPKPPPSSFSTSSSMQVFCKPFWLRPQNDLHPLCGSFVQVCVFPLCASFVQMSCILCAFISPSACLIFNPCILCAFIPPSVCLNF